MSLKFPSPLSRITSLVASLLLLATVFSSVAVVRGQTGQDCDDNAVIRCGITAANLVQKYRENQGGNVQTVFAQFGMTIETAMQGMVSGWVTRNNEVYVGDKLVATNAVTAGRQNMPESTAILNGAFYRRPPSVSFQAERLSALVKMDGETFRYAIIEACGNPVNATDVPNPQPVTPPVIPPTPQPQLQPKFPNFQVIKDVRVKGQTAWMQDVAAMPGDLLEYRVTIRNTGESELTNVVLSDVLPVGVTALTPSPNDAIFSTGVNLGAIAIGQQKESILSVQVQQTADACGTNRLRNRAIVKADGVGEKEDDATVGVCKPQPQPQPLPRPTPPPQMLPDTGAGALLGIFSISGFLGGALYKLKELYANILQR